jgi:hypothetical protein
MGRDAFFISPHVPRPSSLLLHLQS